MCGVALFRTHYKNYQIIKFKKSFDLELYNVTLDCGPNVPLGVRWWYGGYKTIGTTLLKIEL